MSLKLSNKLETVWTFCRNYSSLLFQFAIEHIVKAARLNGFLRITRGLKGDINKDDGALVKGFLECQIESDLQSCLNQRPLVRCLDISDRLCQFSPFYLDAGMSDEMEGTLA
jgi:hypothetical protein